MSAAATPLHKEEVAGLRGEHQLDGKGVDGVEEELKIQAQYGGRIFKPKISKSFDPTFTFRGQKISKFFVRWKV